MLVSHEKRFIFLKTYKTGSTSIEKCLEKYCMESKNNFDSMQKQYLISGKGIITNPRCISTPHIARENLENAKFWDHMPAKDLKSKLPPDVWNTYYKFCIVRNPFDKLKSYYYFINNKKKKTQNFGTISGVYLKNYSFYLEEVNRRNSSDMDFFDSISKSGENICDTNIYTIDGEICVDKIILYENFHCDIKAVFQYLEIPYEKEKIPTINSNITPKQISNKQFFDEKMLSFVREKFAFEIKHFNYSL